MWELSSPTRDHTHIPQTGRQFLNHWTTREGPPVFFLGSSGIARVDDLWHTAAILKVDARRPESPLPGNLLECSLRPHPRLNESEMWAWGPVIQSLNRLSRWLWGMLKFEKNAIYGMRWEQGHLRLRGRHSCVHKGPSCEQKLRSHQHFMRILNTKYFYV